MTTAKTPLVSIITLTWNQTKVTCEFLESTRSFNYKNYEILVLDMGSEIDPTEEISRRNFPNTRVLRSDKNLGFCLGNNWGMREAKGEYFFIVNNDTEVTPDLLDQLLEPFEKDPSIGVTCPKIRFFYDRERIQYAGFNPIDLLTGRTTAVGSLEIDRGQHDISGYTHGAHGCAMLIKKEVVEKAGGLPENYFAYYEEWDWSTRILKAGYKIYYQAKGLIFHKDSVTNGKKSPFKVYYQTRNRILYMRRHANLFQFMAFISFFSLFTVPKALAKYTLTRQFEHLRSFMRGTLWNLRASKN